MSIVIASILFLVSFMVFVSLIIFVIGPVMLLQPHRRTIDYYRKRTRILQPSDLDLPHERLILKTAEGIDLSCWLIKANSKPQGTIIYLHGVSESKLVGLPMAKKFHERGYNVFLYDSRRHGESGGTYCTYGFYEKHDTSTAINYLMGRQDLTLGKIGLFGTSMGAAVAIQVAAIDKRISAVVAESGFATLRGIFDDYQRRMIKLPWHYLRNIVIKRSERIAHFKAHDVSPVDSIRDVHVPILILHGLEDNLIDSVYSEQLYKNAATPKELWLIPHARHSDMPEAGGAEYAERILNFFEKNLR